MFLDRVRALFPKASTPVALQDPPPNPFVLPYAKAKTDFALFRTVSSTLLLQEIATLFEKEGNHPGYGALYLEAYAALKADLLTAKAGKSPIVILSKMLYDQGQGSLVRMARESKIIKEISFSSRRKEAEIKKREASLWRQIQALEQQHDFRVAVTRVVEDFLGQFDKTMQGFIVAGQSILNHTAKPEVLTERLAVLGTAQAKARKDRAEIETERKTAEEIKAQAERFLDGWALKAYFPGPRPEPLVL